MKNIHTKLNIILLEYVIARKRYYNQKLLKNYSLKKLIKESLNRKELPILKYVIVQQFPEHKEFLFKFLLLQ